MASVGFGLVAAAHYREQTRSWEIVLDGGDRYSTQFLIAAIGILSAPDDTKNAPARNLRKSRFRHDQ